ncbi:DUF4112 domain-containing protein [Thalassococcus sp. S3]|uniref:DUF4112 domain-containing protein n=1 Tax=Thalassococcus sp. S3 TaxID=2017482 RepID=UPI00102466D4|nr:DUF4112 domain-containing protein [Thalassococcus sp. S3]QBF31634.1 hypothetical protein CFI11_10450 [Thalassococcus sp. S3]
MRDTHAQRLARLERLAHGMDQAFRVPLIGIRIGWDSLLGLVPGIGDALALGPAGYVLIEGKRMGASNTLLARMAGNVAIDTLIGSIPLIGDLFDIGWKANTRNVALLRRHLERRAHAQRALAA